MSKQAKKRQYTKIKNIMSWDELMTSFEDEEGRMIQCRYCGTDYMRVDIGDKIWCSDEGEYCCDRCFAREVC